MNNIIKNTKRYLELFSAQIDHNMPPRSSNQNPDEIDAFDDLLLN
jgi:hypothetical protein